MLIPVDFLTSVTIDRKGSIAMKDSGLDPFWFRRSLVFKLSITGTVRSTKMVCVDPVRRMSTLVTMSRVSSSPIMVATFCVNNFCVLS